MCTFTVLALLPLVSHALMCGKDAGNVPCMKLASGRSIPAVGMGSWPGSYKDCKSTDFTCVNQHARYAIENWIHIGGRHIDTANDYRTQTSVGEALASSGVNREDFFVTAKCPGAIGMDATMQCVDDNMQMLQQIGTDGYGYVDLLLLHWPEKFIPICRFRPSAPECANGVHALPASKTELVETWRAMEELKRIGVVKSIGVSNYNLTTLEWMATVAKEPIEVNQVEWNPKNHDDKLLQFCNKSGIRLEAWSPLGGKAGSVLSDPVVLDIAKTHGVSTAQVSLRWSVQQGVVPVVGSADAEHQISDMDVFSFELSESEMQRISGLGAPVTAMV